MLTLLSLLLSASPAMAEAVTFRSLDKAWMNVYVDGRQVGELDSFDLQVRVHLEPGVHRVEVRDFMDRRVIDSGWLTVKRGQDLALGVGEHRGLLVYTDPRALSDQAPTSGGSCRAHESHHVRPGDPGSEPVRVELHNIDGTWANVRIDGRLVAELRGPHDEQALRLAPGVYTVQISDFMDQRVWSTGQLRVGCTDELRIGIDERRDPVVYNDPRAWI